MWHTILLSALAGLMGANAIPHFVKGIVGEQFPNVWGNSALRNSVAGTLGIGLAVAFGYWADIPTHMAAAFFSGLIGALVMAVFHGLGGAFRLNSALKLTNPPRAAA
ncbi:hypothetical protein D5S18_20945 [Nocardia panacis]|uniref:Uncharacterized protein n=1 Tax=Nocardia panacis TaxID=2340916 RepID=A0A3A4KGQ3_9NOCA|nr:hypothetical protein [Nocardia panacis]RJO73649.1 hypothetical protein D5S18_20945 [Nocardia panacis]